MLSGAKHLLLLEHVGYKQILRFAQNDKRRAQDDSEGLRMTPSAVYTNGEFALVL